MAQFKPKRDRELTHKVRERIEKWDKWWRINREEYYAWTDFVLGNQWKEDESRLFERYNKVPITVNKLGVLANNLLGEQQQNTPSLQIDPADDVPTETANNRAALIKNLLFDADTKDVFQWAYQCALIGGFGAYGIKSDYDNNSNFYKKIVPFRVNDPARAYWDVSAKSPCKTDGMWGGTRERMSRKMFRSMFGKAIESTIGADSLNTDIALNWADDDSITIIRDNERKYDPYELYELSPTQRYPEGKKVKQEEFDKLEKVKIGKKKVILLDGEPVTIVNQRKVPKYKIIQRQMAGEWILDEIDFPSEQIPLVFVDQSSYIDKNGQQICRSFFKDVKDSQRFLNYLATQIAYLLKVSRYDQYMGPRGCVANPDTQQVWKDPSATQGMLYYDEVESGDKPQRAEPPELSQSLLQQYERTLMDIQSCTGIYNTQLGERGNEISGSALSERRLNSNPNTYTPKNSLNRAITVGAQIIDEMIPSIYGEENRSVMLNLEEGSPQAVTLNQSMDEYGNQIRNNMAEGHYKIRLKAGPSYEGQKREAVESMENVLAKDPSLFRLIGDLYVENLPLSNPIELRNRIRTIISPEIIEAGKTGKPLPPQPQQEDPMLKIKMMDMQLKQAKMQMDGQTKMHELALKQAQLQMSAHETDQELAMKWQQIEAEKLEAAAEMEESKLRFRAEMEKLSGDMQMNHAENIVKLLTHHQKEPSHNYRPSIS